MASTELSNALGADVSIEQLTYEPFNRLILRDVSVTIEGDTVLVVRRLGAGVNLYELVVQHRPVINYVEVIDLKLNVAADSVGAPLNIQPVIDRLKGDGNKKSSDVDLKINTLLLRNLNVKYNIGVADSTRRDNVMIDFKHLEITGISADVLMPQVGNRGMDVYVKRLRAQEVSGLYIDQLTGHFEMDSTRMKLSDLALEAGESYIAFEPITLPVVRDVSPGETMKRAAIHIATTRETEIVPADFAAFYSGLSSLNDAYSLDLSLDGRLDRKLDLNMNVAGSGLSLKTSAAVVSPLDSVRRSIRKGQIDFSLNRGAISTYTGLVPPDIISVVERLGRTHVTSTFSGNLNNAKTDIDVRTDAGSATLKLAGAHLSATRKTIDYALDVDKLDGKALLPQGKLGIIDLSSTGKVKTGGEMPSGEVSLDLNSLEYNGHKFKDINLIANSDGRLFKVTLDSDDPAGKIKVAANGFHNKTRSGVELNANVKRLCLNELGLYNGQLTDLAFNITGRAAGASVDDVTCDLKINNIKVTRPNAPEANLEFGEVKLIATGDPENRSISLTSDIVDVTATGTIYTSTIVPQFKDILTQGLPAVRTWKPQEAGDENRFVYDIKIKDTERWADRLKLPVSVMYPSTISGTLNAPDSIFTFDLDIPFLRQGKKLITETRVKINSGLTPGRSSLAVTSSIPTKHGYLMLDLENDVHNNIVETSAGWFIDRQARFDGDLTLRTTIQRDIDGLEALLNIGAGELTFNDSTWIVEPASVFFTRGLIKCEDINVHRPGQYVKINGRASALSTDMLEVDVMSLDLGYLFESLSIDNVRLGGLASGHFYATSLLSPEPRLITPGLDVKDISFNSTVLGNAVVKSYWNSDARAVALDAVITPEKGDDSYINGAIYPMNDSISLNFDIHGADVSFMHHYMANFTSSVTGHATGKLHLWGNFKYIDLEGDVYPDDVTLKIAFTNTAYTTNDPIRLRPGLISLDNIKVRDQYGNQATVDGWVRHVYFKDPITFDVMVNDVENMLVYDETPARNQRWWGHVFGTGSAHITGEPGIVNIEADVKTTGDSNFTLVLDDTEEAGEYTFITFRDRDKLKAAAVASAEDLEMKKINRLRAQQFAKETGTTSAYNIALTIDVTPDTRFDLVMDPVGGDRIKAWGSCTMRMTYGSADNDLHLFGTYKLDKGNYNFTLQDIIIKDFTITPGSSISFSGDPYKALLDISAAYSLSANLTDLDESFSQDRELNRTTVPVNAMLMVKGDLEHPDISFDLAFPTLNSDTYRKVKSIVSTDEMMNRQIIYLLALNRFYTPDYMGSTTNGSELFSVASATISSQLSNILGHLNDNWSIAPSFRSDRGGFSDVEVDVALSSSLLNNRLLLNGNFGYRDKSLNSTQFVGDFDIEYLLNRSGSVRLKAYNRYNDQNFYVRTALTTQGVGVSYRRNFDSLRDFLKRKHRQNIEPDTIKILPDTIKNDTIR